MGLGGCRSLSGFLNAAPKRLKLLNWNLVTFPKHVLENFWNWKIGNRVFIVAMATDLRGGVRLQKMSEINKCDKKLEQFSFLNETAI